MSSIETRVCLDDLLGPYEATVDPAPEKRWNGWLAPHFTLDTVREMTGRTADLAARYGHDSTVTVHVIDRHADSPSSVHVIDGGTDRDGNPRQAVVHVRWNLVDDDPERAVSFFPARPGTEVTTTEPAGGGKPRSVVFSMDWQWWTDADGPGDVADVYTPDEEGRYAIGAWSWCWDYAVWWCTCGTGNRWHETTCLACPLPRPAQPIRELAELPATIRRLLCAQAPEATSVLVDLHSPPHVYAVYAGDTELDSADDTGPFDTETLGAVDTAIREALDHAVIGDLTNAGWQAIEPSCYRITFRNPHAS
ncbi:hypothetical protein ACPCUF_00970 [Streptomyces griseoincarnatus]